MSDKYLGFINFIFSRDESLGTGWHFDLETDEEERALGLTVEDRIVFIGQMLSNYRNDLAHFSDWQLAHGIEYLFNTATSYYGYEICNADVAIEKRIETILSFKTFYKECYNVRCAPVLSNIDEEGSNALNQFCYMIGDASAITCRDNFPDEINNAILDVLRYILTLDNIACLESALHWLGHIWEEPYRSHAEVIVEEFIVRYEKQPEVNQELLGYAHCAAIGRVL